MTVRKSMWRSKEESSARLSCRLESTWNLMLPPRKNEESNYDQFHERSTRYKNKISVHVRMCSAHSNFTYFRCWRYLSENSYVVNISEGFIILKICVMLAHVRVLLLEDFSTFCTKRSDSSGTARCCFPSHLDERGSSSFFMYEFLRDSISLTEDSLVFFFFMLFFPFWMSENFMNLLNCLLVLLIRFTFSSSYSSCFTPTIYIL